tara:strand:- start:3530 stop:4198 length:669 start_codon:yes stop_codon:yes gene_type:complete
MTSVTIAIDDAHPETGWGVEGDKCMEYLEELNKEFGVKFTLFIPSNYHGNYPLQSHKEWIDWLKSKNYFELAAHGHYHDCRNGGPGECEMTEHDFNSAESRIIDCLNEWDKVEHKPIGWRMPGWLGTQESFDVVTNYFDYIAIHDHHNDNIIFNNDVKIIKGHDGIHETDISLHNNTIMFQSHIAGEHNDNVWNEQNYKQLRMSLQHLVKLYNTEFKTMSEL